MCMKHHAPWESSMSPDAPDPMPVTRCHKCKNEILPGDEYAHFNGVDYCDKCLEDMPLCILVPLIGGEWLKAEREDSCA